MTDVVLPTLAGIARMVPVHDDAVLSNVGSSWTTNAYTVPSGRIFALDWAHLVCHGGLLPTYLAIQIHDAASARQAWLINEKPSDTNDPTLITNTLWVPETWIVHFAIGGGDATTDITWSVSGRLFDWMDVT
ncbi:hypothetical protein LCGC14_1139410 [marine sediment metagenome]|uniref:Uncharacterized protein n=1 Tax=marine sediment metagenome TaxID=412755 RepID=A0A0F9LYS9_9ZZZZ